MTLSVCTPRRDLERELELGEPRELATVDKDPRRAVRNPLQDEESALLCLRGARRHRAKEHKDHESWALLEKFHQR